MKLITCHLPEAYLSGIEEYRDINLADVVEVANYAASIDIYLTVEEAEKVLNACNDWVNGVESGALNGENDYYYTVKQPLLGDEATI